MPIKTFAALVESFGRPQDARPDKPRPGKRSSASLVGLKPGETYGHLKCFRRDGPSGGALEWLVSCKICNAHIRVKGEYLRRARDTCMIDGCNTKFWTR
jgi:hypothetical protein